jgi:hypothetical protein
MDPNPHAEVGICDKFFYPEAGSINTALFPNWQSLTKAVLIGYYKIIYIFHKWFSFVRFSLVQAWQVWEPRFVPRTEFSPSPNSPNIFLKLNLEHESFSICLHANGLFSFWMNFFSSWWLLWSRTWLERRPNSQVHHGQWAGQALPELFLLKLSLDLNLFSN